MQRNVATRIQMFAFDVTTGLPKTGDAANITAYVQKDFGAVTALGSPAATEVDATNAKGMYQFMVAQAETSASNLMFTAKSSTANVLIETQTIYTVPSNFSLTAIDSGGSLALTTAERVSIADALLDRSLAAGADSGGRTVRNALRPLVNKWLIVGTTRQVYKEDDTTIATTSTVTPAPGGDPISGDDPT